MLFGTLRYDALLRWSSAMSEIALFGNGKQIERAREALLRKAMGADKDDMS